MLQKSRMARSASAKVAVLGLITTKRPELELKNTIKHRIDGAAKLVPIEHLALSPQCGFASAITGNELTLDDEAQTGARC